MRIIIISLLSVLCIFGCSSPYSDAPVITNISLNGPETKGSAKLEIEGMMCEIGCAAKIKKELLELEGVSSVIIDFAKDRETHFAIVEYDPRVSNAISNLYSTVNNIADGRLYGVLSVEITNYGPEVE